MFISVLSIHGGYKWSWIILSILYSSTVLLFIISCRDYQWLCLKRLCKCYTTTTVPKNQLVKNDYYTLVVGTSKKNPNEKVVLKWTQFGANWNKLTKCWIRFLSVYGFLATCGILLASFGIVWRPNCAKSSVSFN